MNPASFGSRANTQILEEASAWFIEVSEGPLDPAAREAFDRWLRTSPEHVRAYLEAAVIWDNADAIDKARLHGADELVAMARRSATVVSLGKDGLQNATRAPQATSRRSAGIWALAATLTLAVGGAIAWSVWSGAATYRTAVGQQLSIVLPDGSTVMLNSSSRIRVMFNARERRIALLKGQALFTAAPDPARPFTVISGPAQVVALGTQFDIDRRRSATVVTVLEGRVAVTGEDVATAGPATLSAGEQVVVSRQQVSPGCADVAAATAWTQRRLIFTSTPLIEVAEEYNRHHSRRLIVRDPSLAQVRISGSFSSIDATSLIDFLRAQPEIAVRETIAGMEIVAAPGSAER